MFKSRFFIFMVYLLHASVSLALMPPMEEGELESQANTIVIGEITDVLPTGERRSSDCVDKTGYKAKLKVEKVLKGNADSKLYISFLDYDFKNGCVGSPDRKHHKGEKGKYYLSCQSKECRLVHWNGFIPQGEKGFFPEKN